MLDTVLTLQNPHWTGISYEGLFERAQLSSLIQKLALKEIQVLLGIRRSGKSTLFKLTINALLKNAVEPRSILYLNLDDPVYSEVWQSAKQLYQIIETAEKLTGVKIKYFFLDEVQNIDGWERFVKSVYDSELFKKIFITGSNSSLLKSTYASLLSGRYLIDRVMPLSFKEILHTEGIDNALALIQAKPKVLKMLENMLFNGSFPQIWQTDAPELKREQLINYYETILLKDCIGNHRIRETKKFQELAIYLLNNNASLFSYNSVAEIIGSNENTIKEFIQILENSFLISEIKHFSHSLKKQSKSRKKTYCVDNGLIHTVSLQLSDNRGRLLENLVFTELQKKGCHEISFYHDQKECDFIVKIRKRLIAIQVTYAITQENYAREVNGLKNALQQLSAEEGYIITFNSEAEIIEKNIHILPFWKFFFEDFISIR